MATIQERTGKDGKACYRVQIRLKGYPPQTATFERKTDAKLWAQQTESAIRDGRHFKTSEAKRHTLGEMIDRYIADVLPQKRHNSVYGQGIQLRWWKEQLGHHLLSDVTPALVAECRDRLASGDTPRHKRRSSSTVIRYLAALSHCFTIAMKEWGWLDDNPLRKVTKPKEAPARVRFLSDEERGKLLDACRKSRNPYLYDIVVLALSTGMRRNEILGLTWDKVDFGRRVITLQPDDTKNSERRAVPLVRHAFDLLYERSKIRRIDTPYVFPAPYRHGEEPKPIDIQSAWDAAIERSKIDNFRFHDLRHSAASYLAMGGATLAEIAEVLGHKTLAMVKRYSHLSEAHTSKVVERMNAAIFNASDSGVMSVHERNQAKS